MSSLSRTTVIVAGAGLAGLVASRELRARGARTIVIEARDRVGGRIVTHRSPFAAGQSAEAGGEMIDDDQEAIVALARELRLPLARILRGGFGAYRTTGSGKRRLMLNASRGWRRLGEQLAREVEWFRAADERLDSAVAETLSRESVSAWLDRIEADRDLRSIAEGLAGFFVASPDDLSLLPLVELAASFDTPGQERMYRIEGGNDRLPQLLAAPLGRDLRLQTTLDAVTQHARGVTATVTERSARAQVRGDYLVCTLPATTVRNVSFTPPLSDLQDAAFRTLTYGAAAKHLLQFDRRFWRGLGRPLAYGTDLDIGAVWDANGEQEGPPGILALMAGGRISARAQAVAAHGAEHVVRQLAWLRPGNARLLAMTQTVWEDDPWARGAYAYFGPSYDATLRLWLSRPFNRVLFAGEHTSVRWQGYMNGAVESGRRAAVEIEAMESRRRAAR
jgi:monoamine oxidase